MGHPARQTTFLDGALQSELFRGPYLGFLIVLAQNIQVSGVGGRALRTKKDWMNTHLCFDPHEPRKLEI